LIYSASQDRTIIVWNTDGKIVRTLQGHGHWVNSICLSTDYALRTAYFTYKGEEITDKEQQLAAAKAKYLSLKGDNSEKLASSSDDHSVYLWDPEKSKNPVIRLTGHQGPINLVSFSNDGRKLASGSFDKSIKIWDGKTGKFEATMRGHVGAVYQVSWSGDGRMIASGSQDSTIKLWTVKTGKLVSDLPGHADEVYSVDWSPNGEKLASGGKDAMLKIWKP